MRRPPGIGERVLRIAHVPSGNWNFVVPCFARNTNGDVEAV